MKIYAITKGIYSDYRILALTIDKDKAERIKAAYSDGYHSAMIEEFEDGEDQDIRIMYRYDPDEDSVCVWDYEDKEAVWTYMNGDIECVYVYASDPEHARKKAQDMIAEYKAELEGIC